MSIRRFRRLLRNLLGPAIRTLRATQNDRIPEYVAGGLKLGKNVHIQPGFKIDSSHYWHISIGDEVTIAPGVHIIAHDASTKIHLGYVRLGKISVGNRVFIGAGSILLPGASIGDNSIIGAGSVVSSTIPPNVVAAGNPARVLCSLEAFLEKRRNEMAISPVFGEEYTVRQDVPNRMRSEMNARMKNGVGYVV